MSQGRNLEAIQQEAKGYLQLIENVYAGVNTDIKEAELLGKLLKLLAELPAGFHLFCDPTIEPISVFCLTIFSFHEENTVNWLKNRFNTTLGHCQKCVLNFVRGKCKMLQHFAIQRNVPHEHVSKFNDIVCAWRAEYLLPVLTSIAISNGTEISVTSQVNVAIFECLCNPHTLRLNQTLKAAFNAIFKYFYISKQPLLSFTQDNSINIFVAGVIYCLCEGTEEEIQWAKIFIQKLYKHEIKFDPKHITSDILEELSMHYLFLQNPANWNDLVISLFWSKLIPVFTLFDKDVFKEHFESPKNLVSLQSSLKFPIESIFKLWYNHLTKPSRDKPLEFLLRALNMFLDKWSDEFWFKIDPYTFHNILDAIFDKSYFSSKLIRSQNNPIPDDDIAAMLSSLGSITDLVSWTLPFYRSLTPSKRIQMVKKVSMAFLKIMVQYKELSSISKACLINSSTALLRAVLTVKESDRTLLYKSDNFETVLYTKTDSRALLNNPLVQDILLRSATKPLDLYPDLGDSVTSVSTSAMMVLTKAINFDILLLCEFTYKIYKGKKIGQVHFNKGLIENLSHRLDFRSFHDGPLLGEQLLVSLKNINGLLIVPAKTPDAVSNNLHVSQFLSSSTKLIEKFTDILPNELKKILSHNEAAQGFWSCIFSANSDIYQTTTNILYDTFDVQGRLEGVQSILTLKLNPQLKAINEVIAQLVKAEFYEPCPRTINILKDIVSAFSDPMSGIFSNIESLKDSETETLLFTFWKNVWSFLDMIYVTTLSWASKYEYSELENFTKDTLDLSRSLLASFREFSDILKNTNNDLFQSVLIAFRNMLYWLRLSDEILLDSCVRLIVNTSDIAAEKNLQFSDELVELMAKYASKAKKFSNKLTDLQTEEILAKARSFNSKKTDIIVQESERYHQEKLRAKEQLSSHGTSSGSRPESRMEMLQRKALSSSLTNRPKSTQSKITSFGIVQPNGVIPPLKSASVKPLSKMELARKQLLSNRVVHPPSTSVFHTKTNLTAKKNDGSSSDESEGDLESARELFAHAKTKSKTIEILDINGKVVKAPSNSDRIKMEQEYMRLRLNIDTNLLYKIILLWDFNRKDDYPDDTHKGSYHPVKDKFRSVLEYQQIVRPLLLLECWQGLCNTRDKEDYIPFSIVVGNRTAVSDFYEVYASVSKQMLQTSTVAESDLIVLGHFPNVNSRRLSSDDFKNVEHTCLAKVRSMKNAKGDKIDLTLRVHRSHPFTKFLTLREEIHAMKVMQMTTVEREYTTLEGLQYYDLVQQILEATPAPHIEAPRDEIEKVKVNYELNTSQAEAIVNTITNSGFSLIQGPPGTGKTKTILGIIGYFLSITKLAPANTIRVPGSNLSSSQSTDQLLKKQKILICAPSNAAIDEIVLRLKNGIKDRDGKQYTPKLVRVGRSDAVSSVIKDVTLEEQVEKLLAEKNYEFTNNPELNKKFNDAISKRRTLRDTLDKENGSASSRLSTEDIANLQVQIRQLSKEINELGKEKDEIREKNTINYRNRDLDRRNAQARIMAQSDIICSTLSGSAHDVLASLGVRFDTVIVDEACQCTELSSIIPLRYGAKRCIMVGDPNQLPPTVLSGAATNLNYNQSLFVRMEKNVKPYLLNVQYRMHPSISKFPSSEFYKGELKDGPDMEKLNIRPWHAKKQLPPYAFFDTVTGRQEQNLKSMSFVNKDEVQVAIDLIDFLLKHFEKTYDFRGKIGVISPYKEQMLKMKKDFKNYFGGSINKYIDFNTIDGFQGQEKEIVIISCVRADDSKTSVGFLKDFRRMNVALTRAKTSMWILGHHKSLSKSKLWRHLIKDAFDRDALEIAFPGFLHDNNAKSKAIRSKYNDFHEYLSSDGYDPNKKYGSDIKRKSVDEGPAAKKYQKVDKDGKTEKSDDYNEQKKKGKAADKMKKKVKTKVKEKEPSNSLASGTKKKSSIFGTPSFAKEIIETAPTTETKKKSNKRDNRHVSFSDNITYISSKEGSTKFYGTEDKINPASAGITRIKSPPPALPPSNTNENKETEDDNYNPYAVESNFLKRNNNYSNPYNSNADMNSASSASRYQGYNSNNDLRSQVSPTMNDSSYPYNSRYDTSSAPMSRGNSYGPSRYQNGGRSRNKNSSGSPFIPRRRGGYHGP